MKTAFIGLGVMGYPMAGHLQKGGHDVTVYNRNPAKAKQWVAEYGGKTARHPGRSRQGPGHRVLLRRPRFATCAK